MLGHAGLGLLLSLFLLLMFFSPLLSTSSQPLLPSKLTDFYLQLLAAFIAQAAAVDTFLSVLRKKQHPSMCHLNEAEPVCTYCAEKQALIRQRERVVEEGAQGRWRQLNFFLILPVGCDTHRFLESELLKGH